MWCRSSHRGREALEQSTGAGVAWGWSAAKPRGADTRTGVGMETRQTIPNEFIPTPFVCPHRRPLRGRPSPRPITRATDSRPGAYVRSLTRWQDPKDSVISVPLWQDPQDSVVSVPLWHETHTTGESLQSTEHQAPSRLGLFLVSLSVLTLYRVAMNSASSSSSFPRRCVSTPPAAARPGPAQTSDAHCSSPGQDLLNDSVILCVSVAKMLCDLSGSVAKLKPACAVSHCP